MSYWTLILLGLKVGLNAATLTGTVTSVYDGDTLILKSADGTVHKIRLEHIDTPEVNPKQDHGIEARDALRALVLNKSVTVNWLKKDRYQRKIGIVLLGQTNINLRLVKQGHAWHYKKYSNDSQYAAAESQAKSAGRGLWSKSNPVAPWKFRNGSNSTGGGNRTRINLSSRHTLRSVFRRGRLAGGNRSRRR